MKIQQDDESTRHGLLDRTLIEIHPGVHETTRAPMVSIALANVAFALTADDADAIGAMLQQAARTARAATAKSTPTPAA